MQVKQIYHPYWKWECYNNGMWSKVSLDKEQEIIERAIIFTGNYIEYGNAMIDVVNNWHYSLEHHLTDNSINQRAYIGHAACNYKFGWAEYLVRAAWNKLDPNQQRLANAAADSAIELWKNKRYAKTLFEL